LNDLQLWLNVDNISNRLGITRPAEQAPGNMSQNLPESLNLEDEIPEMTDDGTVTPVRMDVSEIVSRAITPKVKVKEKPKSIVEQIDDILQKRLLNSPYSNRLIRLVDAPGGGVEVLVDAKKYEGVGEVPDLEVRNFIQDCVKEWEKGK